VTPDKVKFKKYLELSSELEDPDGLFCLSDCYLHGTDGFEKNILLARQILEKSASLNHCESIVSLGTHI
jgi:TPR repeat protein